MTTAQVQPATWPVSEKQSGIREQPDRIRAPSRSQMVPDAVDGTTDQNTAAELMNAVQHVVGWDKSYPLVLFSAWPGLFFFCHDLDELTPANEDCVYGGRGHTAHYAGFMTARLRAVGKENEYTLTIWLAPPVVHFGEDVSVMIEVTNRTDQPWTGDLVVWLEGFPITSPLASENGPMETVWQTSEPISLDPGQRTMPAFTISADAFAGLGFGEYYVRVEALGERTAGRLYLTGAPEVEIHAPAHVALDEVVEVTAVVRNPTEADVHDVWIRPMNPAMDEHSLGTLPAGGETAVTWTFTPEESGKETAGVLVETAGAGATEAAGVVHVLAPPELLITVDAPERVEVGDDFEIMAEVANPGDAPVAGVTAVLAGYAADLVLLHDDAEVEIGELDAGAMTEVRWQATALAAGRATARVEAAGDEIDARHATSTVIAEPGHGADLVVEDAGRDQLGGMVIAEAPVGSGTNFISAGYDVEITNTGTAADVVVVSVFPGEDCVAFGENEDDEEEDAWSRRELTIAAGETLELSLTLRSWNDEATARVVVRSLGDLTQWDQMVVVARYTDGTSLQVTPEQLSLTIGHGEATTSVIEVTNTGSTPLTNVELSPRGNIVGWITLERTLIAEIAPDETVPVNVNVTVPRYQAPGDYGGGVRVACGSQSAGVSINVRVPEAHAVVLTLTPDSRSVVPGNTPIGCAVGVCVVPPRSPQGDDVGVFVLGVKNEGNVSDGYDLTVDGLPDGWEVSWSRNPPFGERGPSLASEPAPGQCSGAREVNEKPVLVEPGARADVALLIVPLRAHWTAPDWYGFTVAANDDAEDQIDGEIEALVFHDVDLAIEGAEVVPGPPIIVDKVWKKAHEHPHGRLAVIIKTHGTPSESALAALRGHGVTVKRRFRLVDAIAAEIPVPRLTEIAAEPFVARIELDEEVTAFADVGALGVDGLYADGYDGSGVVVAVVDTGVDLDHPTLPNLAAGYDFVNDDADPDDDHGHGTHVAGIVGAQDAEYPGVAPGVVLLPVKVLDASGTGMSSDVIAGIEWSVGSSADVVNLSLGSTGNAGGTSALSEAADNAVRSGVVVVAAAGNSGPDFETVAAPADAKLVIGVGALETTTAVADFSSRGPTLDGRVKPDVVAPGVDVVSTWSDGGFHALSSTSMAAPHVAGVVALLLHAHPEATPELVREALASSAVRLDGAGSNTQGAGRVHGDGDGVDLGQALTVVSSTTAPGDTAEYAFTLTNLGNVVDGFNLGVDAEELPLTVLVFPKAIGESWTTLPPSPVGLNPAEQTAYLAEIAVPDHWAGMESVSYRFKLTTTSTGKPEVGEAERGALGVEATKRSKIEYARLEILTLHEDIGRASKPKPLRAKLDAELDKVDKAIRELVSGDLIGTNTSLDAAVNKMEAFVNEVEAQRRNGKLDASAAESLLSQAEAVIVHLVGARMTDLP